MRVLAADVGGTHARVAVYDDAEPIAQFVVATKDFESATGTELLAHALETMRAETGIPAASIAGACLAVAGPVNDGRVSLTNVALEFSVVALERTFGFPVALVNDLVGFGSGIATLAEGDSTAIGRSVGDADADAPRAVVVAGTGLGMSVLIREGNDWQVLASEGGHAAVAATDAFERELVAAAQELVPVVTYEHFLAGPGLVNLYRAMCRVWGSQPQVLQPEEITRRGLELADPVCHKTLEAYAGFLGTASGTLALMCLAQGGVYLGGSVLNALSPVLADGAFRRCFLGTGLQAELLARAPTRLVTADSVGLAGAARYGSRCFAVAG